MPIGRPITKTQHRIAITASLLLAATAINLPRALVGEASAPSAPLAPVSDCVVTVTHRVAPPLLLAGEQAEISMRVEPYCPLHQSHLHVVFVLPSSSEVPASDRQRIRDEVEALADTILALNEQICCGSSDEVRVGIATFDTTGRVACYLTNDPVKLFRCIGRINRGQPGHAVEQGLKSGSRILLRDRPQDESVNEVMILVAGRERIDNCNGLARTAAGLKAQRIMLMTVCAGEACDEACLRGVANAARHFHMTLDPVYRNFEIGPCECMNIKLRQSQWSTTLAPDLAYVEGSASMPVEFREADAALAWSLNFIPREGLTLSYRVRPNWLGFRQVEFDSEFSFLDGRGRAGAASSTSTLDLAVFRPFREEP